MSKYIFTTLFILLTATLTSAQDTTSVQSEGWQVGFGLDIAGWSTEYLEQEPEVGVGASGDFGYNINEHVGFYVPFRVTSFNPSEGGNYAMFNVGIGGEVRFNSDNDNVRPVINASYNSVWLYQNLVTGDLNIITNGPGLGGGLIVKVGNDINMRLRYTRYWTNITTVTIGGDEYDAEGDMTSGNFSIGIVRYF